MSATTPDRLAALLREWTDEIGKTRPVRLYVDDSSCDELAAFLQSRGVVLLAERDPEWDIVIPGPSREALHALNAQVNAAIEGASLRGAGEPPPPLCETCGSEMTRQWICPSAHVGASRSSGGRTDGQP